MGASVQPVPDLDALIASRRQALTPTPQTPAPLQGTNNMDSLIASRRQALSSGPGLAPSDATSARVRVAPAPHSLKDDIVGGAGAVAQGASGGLFDEMAALEAGLVANPLHPLAHFEKLRQEAAAPEKQFAANHPVLDMGAQLGGAVGSTALAGGVSAARYGAPVALQAAEKLPIAQRMLNVAKGVGAAGAVGGAVGAASGDGSFADRVASAERGAELGAGLSLGGSALGSAARTTGVPKLLSNLMPRPATEASPLAGLVASHENMAARDILADVDRSGLPIDTYLDRAKQNPQSPLYDLGPSMPQGTGSPLIRRDPAGDPLVRRARGVQSIPSTGSAQLSDFVNQRAEQRPGILRNALESGLGETRQNVVQSLAQDATDRSAASTDFYNTLRSHYDLAPKRITALDQQLGKPSFETAVKETENILRERDPRNFTPLVQTAPNGARQMRPLTFTEADLLKRSLDDVSDVAKVPNPIESGGVTKTRRGDMLSTGGQVTDALDKAFPGNQKLDVPSYADVRGQHADASALINAKDAGTHFMRTNGDQLEADLSAMSPAQQQSYRQGAIGAVEDDMAKGNVGKWLIGPNARKLQLLFPDPQSYSEFEMALRRQVQGASNDAMIMRGSPTARIQAEQSDLGAEHAPVEATRALLSPVHAAAGSVVNSAVGARLRGITEARADALAPYLTAQGPVATQKLLLLKSLQEDMARAAKASQIRNVRAAGQIGGTMGPNSTP